MFRRAANTSRSRAVLVLSFLVVPAMAESQVDHAVRAAGAVGAQIFSDGGLVGERFRARHGYFCHLKLGVDPDFEHFPEGPERAELRCADETLGAFDASLNGARQVFLLQRAPGAGEGPCRLFEALGIAPESVDAARGELHAMGASSTDLEAVRARVRQKFGARLDRLTKREATNLGFCLYLARAEIPQPLDAVGRARSRVERAIELELRNVLARQHRTNVDFDLVMKEPQRFAAAIASRGVCPRADRPASLFEAYVLRESLRLRGEAERIARWRARHPSGEPLAGEAHDAEYRAVVRKQLCTLRGNEDLEADLEDFLGVRGDFARSGETAPPYLDLALRLPATVPTDGNAADGAPRPLASLLVRGLPMPPSRADRWARTLESCPGLLQSLRDRFQAGFLERLTDAPLSPTHFSAGRNPERTDLTGYVFRTAERVRLVVKLVEKGFLCSETSASLAGDEAREATPALRALTASLPSSLEELRRRFDRAVEALRSVDAQRPRHLALEAATRLFEADDATVRRLAEEADARDRANATFVPTALAFQTQATPACWLPHARDPRFFLADTSSSNGPVATALDTVDGLLRHGVGCASDFEKSFLWFVNGRSGPAPRAALPAENLRRGLAPSALTDFATSPAAAWTRVFSDGARYREWLARFLPADWSSQTGVEASIEAAQRSANPVFALAAVREALLDAALEPVLREHSETRDGVHYRERMASERRALQALQSDLCRNFAAGGTDLAAAEAFVAALRPLAVARTASSFDDGASPFSESLLRLVLSLSPELRGQITGALGGEGCFERHADARHAIATAIFVGAPAAEASAAQKMQWVDRLKSMAAACRLAERLSGFPFRRLVDQAPNALVLERALAEVAALPSTARDVRVEPGAGRFVVRVGSVRSDDPTHALPSVPRGPASAAVAPIAAASVVDPLRRLLDPSLSAADRPGAAERFRADWSAAYGDAEAFPNVADSAGWARLRSFVYFRAAALAGQADRLPISTTSPPEAVARDPRALRAWQRGQELAAAVKALDVWLSAPADRRGSLPHLAALAHLDSGELLHAVTAEEARWAAETQDLVARNPVAGRHAHHAFDALRTFRDGLVRRANGDRQVPSAAHAETVRRTLTLQWPVGGMLPTYSIEIPVASLRSAGRVSDAVLAQMLPNCRNEAFEWVRTEGRDIAPPDFLQKVRDRHDERIPTDRTIGLRLEKLLCWTAFVTAPLAPNRPMEIPEESENRRALIDAVRTWLDRGFRIQGHESDPVLSLLDGLARRTDATRAELIAMRDGNDAHAFARSRDVVSLALALGSAAPHFSAAVDVAIPPHVAAARASFPELGARLRAAPPEWLATQWALFRAHSVDRSRPGLPTAAEVRTSLERASQRQAQLAGGGEAPPVRPAGPAVPMERLSELSRAWVRQWVSSVVGHCVRNGRLDLGCVRATPLPLRDLEIAFEDTRTLGGEALSLGFTRELVRAQRAALRAYLNGWTRRSPFGTGAEAHDLTMHPVFVPLLTQARGFFEGGDANDGNALTRAITPGVDRRSSFADAELALQQLEDVLTQSIEREATVTETAPLADERDLFRGFAEQSGVRHAAVDALARRFGANGQTQRAALDTAWRGPRHESAVTDAAYLTTPGIVPGSPFAPFPSGDGRFTRVARASIPSAVHGDSVFGGTASDRAAVAHGLESERHALQVLAQMRANLGELFLCMRNGPGYARIVGGREFPPSSVRPSVLNASAIVAERKRQCEAWYNELLQAMHRHEASLRAANRSSARFRPPTGAFGETLAAFPPFLRQALERYAVDTVALPHDAERERFERLRQAPWPGTAIEFLRRARMAGSPSHPEGSLCSSTAGGLVAQMRGAAGFEAGLGPVADLVASDFGRLCGDATPAQVEESRAKALTLLLSLYANHPLVGLAREVTPAMWTAVPPSELVVALQQRLREAIALERQTLATKDPLEAKDVAKQILMMAVLLAEERGSNPTGNAVVASELARGGFDRLSPLHAAFFATMERAAAPVEGSRIATLVPEDQAGNLGTHFSGQQRVALAAWTAADWQRFAALERYVAEPGHDQRDRKEPFYRHLRQTLSLSVPSIAGVFDPNRVTEHAGNAAPLAADAVVESRVREALAAGRDFDGPEREWVAREVALRASLPSNGGRARSEVEADVLDELRFSVAERELAALFERHSSSGDARTRLRDFETYLNDVATRMVPFAATSPAVRSGLFSSPQAANAHSERLRRLVDPSARRRANGEPLPPAEIDAAASRYRRENVLALGHAVAARAMPLGRHAAADGTEVNIPSAVDIVRGCDLRSGEVAGRTRAAEPAEAAAAVTGALAQIDRSHAARCEHNRRRFALEEQLRAAQRLATSLRLETYHLEQGLARVTERMRQAEGVPPAHPYFLDDEQRRAAETQRDAFAAAIEDRRRRSEAAQRSFDALLASLEGLPAPPNEPPTALLTMEARAVVADHEHCVAEGFAERLRAMARLRGDAMPDAAVTGNRHARTAAESWYVLAKQVALRHVRRQPGRPEVPTDVPAEAAELFAGPVLQSLFGGNRSAAEAEWSRVLQRAVVYEQGLRAAAAPLAAFGLSLTALTASPADFSGLRVPEGRASVRTDELRGMLRELQRHLEGEAFLTALPATPPPGRPELDDLANALEVELNAAWTNRGRPERTRWNDNLVIAPRPDADRGAYGFEIFRKSDEQARGRRALAQANRILEQNPARYKDLRAARNQMFDFRGHEQSAELDVRIGIAGLNSAISTLSELGNVPVSAADGEPESSALSHASRLAVGRDLNVRLDLADNARLMESDRRWRHVSHGLLALYVAGTIATGGSAAPLVAALHTGFHGGLIVTGIAHFQAGLSDLGDHFRGVGGLEFLNDPDRNWTDVGRGNLVGSAAFFAGGALGRVVAHSTGLVAAVRASVAAEGISTADLGAMLARAEARLAANPGAALVGEELTLLRLANASTLESAVGTLRHAMSWRGAGMAGYHANFGTAGNVGITYAASFLAHSADDYVHELSLGRQPVAADIARRHLVTELSTALFAAGGDRRLADLVRPFLGKMALAGGVNVSISSMGSALGSSVENDQMRRTIARLMALPPGDGRRDAELEAMVRTLREAEARHRASVGREWVDRVLVDGFFAYKASRASYQAQPSLRFRDAIDRGEDPGVARAAMQTEAHGRWMGAGVDGITNPIEGGRRVIAAIGGRPEPRLVTMPGGAEALLHAVAAARRPGASEALRSFVEEEFATVRTAMAAHGVDLTFREFADHLEAYVALPAELRGESPEPSHALFHRGPDGRLSAEGPFTNYGDWVQASMFREALGRIGTRNASRPTPASLRQESELWSGLLTVSPRAAADVPGRLLVDGGLRARAIAAYVSQRIVSPNDRPAFERQTRDLAAFFQRRLAAGQVPARAEELFGEFEEARPTNDSSPVAWMERRQVPLAEYFAIFGADASATSVAAHRLVALETAAGRLPPPVEALEAFLRRELRTPDNAARSDARWLAEFRSRGLPVTP